MTKTEFLARLEELLKDVPVSEKESAIQYYNDYFEDAGSENEEEVIDALGTPEDVALNIKAGINGTADSGEYTENGYSANTANKDSVTVYHPNTSGTNTNAAPVQQKKGLSGGVIALIVILCILASPLLIGIAGAAFGLLVAFVAVVFSLAVAAIAIVFAFLAAAIGCAIFGICAFPAAPMAGLMAVGASLIMVALTLISLWIMVAFCGVVIPWVFRGIGKLWRKLFPKKGGNR